MQRYWAGALAVLALGACGDSGPGRDEQAVCAAVQGLVDDVATGEAAAVRRRVGELRGAVGTTSDESLSFQGDRFFRTIDQPVGPWDDMTVQEINTIGQRALAEAAGALEGLIVACRNLGVEIERLPQGPRPRG